MLVIIGTDEYGEKDVLAIVDGFCKNADSWRDLLKRLQKHGLFVLPELAMLSAAWHKGQACWNDLVSGTQAQRSPHVDTS